MRRALTARPVRRLPALRAGDQRGIALPLALLTLLVLAALSMVLATLARTEPTIAANHLRSFQARVLAESGIEHAVWALTNATSPGGIGGSGTAPNIVVTASPASPYDGSTFIALGAIGGFSLTVTGSDPNARSVRSVGWSPAGDLSDARLPAKSQVVATLVRLRNLPREAPCALCVGSSLTLTAPTVVDARGSEASDCGGKLAAASAGDLGLAGASDLFGAGAPAGDRSANVEDRDFRRGQSLGVSLSPDDLDTLKALASAHGTYVRPVSDLPLELAAIPDGLVFVDTPSGSHTLTAANLARVRIGPGFAASSIFRGWIVVSGDVALEGSFGEIRGIVYAVNALAATDVGGSRVTGVVIAGQALGASSLTLGSVTIVFDCAAARASGLLPAGWFVRPGSYCDRNTSC